MDPSRYLTTRHQPPMETSHSEHVESGSLARAQPHRAAGPDGAPEPSPEPVDLRHLSRYLPASLWREMKQAPASRQTLLKALSALHSHLYTLTTYVPRHLVTQTLAQVDPRGGTEGARHGATGERLHGSLLFADISGFTRLSERLAQGGEGGIERLTGVLNEVFSAMVDILARSGGILLKFAGDALLAYFPAQTGEAQAPWAVRTALRMLAAIGAFAAIETPAGPVGLQMKIGIATGDFHGIRVGSTQRSEYTVAGAAIGRTMAAESLAEAGAIVVDAATKNAYGEVDTTPLAGAPPAFYAVDPATANPDGYEIQVAAQRRSRTTAAWLGGIAELMAEIDRTVAQIEALSPYLPEELRLWLRAGAWLPASRAENRPTAVIFVNVVGFEALLACAAAIDDGIDTVYGMLDDYFRAVQRSVHHFGGVVSRIDPYREGSKLLLLFGAPRAHEDDSVRAVRAALRLREALVTLNRRWQQRLRRIGLAPETAAPVWHRVGVTYGITFAGLVGAPTRREYTVMGDDVNLAARLMGAGTPDQILVSAAIAEAVAGQMVLTSMPALKVKGKAAPVVVWQVEGPADPPDVTGPAAAETPLVGREAELARARKVLRTAIAGAGTHWTLQGEAGIGKSRLIEAVAVEARASGVSVWSVRSASFGNPPYGPWIDLIRAMARIPLAVSAAGDGAEAEGQAQALAAFLDGLGFAPADHPEALAELLELPQRGMGALSPGHAITPVTATATHRAPGLFGRIGAQTAGPAPTDAAASAPALTNAGLWQTARRQQRGPQAPPIKPSELTPPSDLTRPSDLVSPPEFATPDRTWQQLGVRISRRARARLFDAVRSLIRRYAQRQPLMIVFENAQWLDGASQALLQHVAESLAGLPVLLVSVRRAVPPEPGGGSAADVPSDEAAILTLQPLTRAATSAHVAALLGDAAPPATVARLGEAFFKTSGGYPLIIEELATWWRSHRDDQALTAGLRASRQLNELVTARVDDLPPACGIVVRCAAVLGGEFTHDDLLALLPDETALAAPEALAQLQAERILVAAATGDGPRLAFRQALIRELVYESLPLAQRRASHSRAAAHLEATHAQDLGAVAEVLAHHHRHAGHWEPAARYDLLAGRKAAQHQAYNLAEAAYRRALTALDALADAPERSTDGIALLRARIHEALGDAVLLQGAFDVARIAYYTAQSQVATTREDDAERLLFRLTAKATLVLPGADAEDGDVAQPPHAAGGQTPDDVPQRVTCAAMACRLHDEHPEEAREWAARATALPDDRRTGAYRWIEALMLELSGAWDAAYKAFQALGEPAGAALALCQRAAGRSTAGDTAAAAAILERALTLWRASEDAHGLGLAYLELARARWHLGRHAAARPALEEAGAHLAEAGAVAQSDLTVTEDLLRAYEQAPPSTWDPVCWRAYVRIYRTLALFRILDENRATLGGVNERNRYG